MKQNGNRDQAVRKMADNYLAMAYGDYRHAIARIAFDIVMTSLAEESAEAIEILRDAGKLLILKKP